MAYPVIVQHNSKAGVNAQTVSFTNPVTPGSMILVWIGTANAGGVGTPTMTGETFTKITNASNSTSNANAELLYATNNAVGGQTSVTAGSGGSVVNHVHIIEISNKALNPIDATGNQSLSLTLSVSTSKSTLVDTDLVIAFFAEFLHLDSLTVTAPFVQLELSTLSGSAAISGYNFVSSKGIQTATGGGNSSDAVVQGIIAIAGLTPQFVPTFGDEYIWGGDQSAF